MEQIATIVMEEAGPYIPVVIKTHFKDRLGSAELVFVRRFSMRPDPKKDDVFTLVLSYLREAYNGQIYWSDKEVKEQPQKIFDELIEYRQEYLFGSIKPRPFEIVVTTQEEEG